MAPSKKAFFAILGIILLTIAAGVGVGYLFDKQLISLNDEVGKLKAEQEAVRSQISIYETARKKVEELAFVEELANNVLPQSKEQANVVAELKQFIANSGLQFDSIAFTGNDVKGNAGFASSQTEQVEGLNGVRVLPASVVIKTGANYDQVLKLLETIELNQRKMQITEITLIPNDESANTFSTITMSLNIYLRV